MEEVGEEVEEAGGERLEGVTFFEAAAAKQ